MSEAFKNLNEKIAKILNGHTSFETAYKVEDYPYGYTLRTTLYAWIETVKGKGDRYCTQTINPKNGRLNAPKKSTYSPFLFMYLDKEGHIHHGGFGFNNYMPQNEAALAWILEHVGEENLSDLQKEEIRSNIVISFKIGIPYRVAEYPTDEQKEAYKEWAKSRLTHMIKAPFNQIHIYQVPKPEPVKEAEA